MEIDYDKLALALYKIKRKEESQNPRKVINVKSTTDIGEAYDNLDNEDFIDMNTRLDNIQIPAVNTIEELKYYGGIPKSSQLADRFKKLQVSFQGKGRNEKVSVATGTKPKPAAAGSFADLFKRREKKDGEEQQQPTAQFATRPTG